MSCLLHFLDFFFNTIHLSSQCNLHRVSFLSPCSGFLFRELKFDLDLHRGSDLRGSSIKSYYELFVGADKVNLSVFSDLEIHNCIFHLGHPLVGRHHFELGL
jgi:hypothetical protein